MCNFIANPKTGSGKGLKIWKAISRYMESHNAEYKVFLTEGIGDAKTAAMRLTDSCDEPRYIIAVGGDGAMNEVLDGMSFHGPPNLGYIPADPGNDLTRSPRMPGRTIKCLKEQLAPRYFAMTDYGVLTYEDQEVSHHRFLAGAGIGFDIAVCQDALSPRCRQRSSRLGMGKLSYMLIGIYQFFKRKFCKGYILLDGVKKVEFDSTLFISCHTQPSEGGGFLFAPRADGSNGKLDIYVMSHGVRTKPIPFLLSAPIGRRRPKGVRTYECREASIYTEVVLPVHVDGENCDFQTDIQVDHITRKVGMMI